MQAFRQSRTSVRFLDFVEKFVDVPNSGKLLQRPPSLHSQPLVTPRVFRISPPDEARLRSIKYGPSLPELQNPILRSFAEAAILTYRIYVGVKAGLCTPVSCHGLCVIFIAICLKLCTHVVCELVLSTNVMKVTSL